jgi:hypothetical protein
MLSPNFTGGSIYEALYAAKYPANVEQFTGKGGFAKSEHAVKTIKKWKAATGGKTFRIPSIDINKDLGLGWLEKQGKKEGGSASPRCGSVRTAAPGNTKQTLNTPLTVEQHGGLEKALRMNITVKGGAGFKGMAGGTTKNRTNVTIGVAKTSAAKTIAGGDGGYGSHGGSQGGSMGGNLGRSGRPASAPSSSRSAAKSKLHQKSKLVWVGGANPDCSINSSEIMCSYKYIDNISDDDKELIFKYVASIDLYHFIMVTVALHRLIHTFIDNLKEGFKIETDTCTRSVTPGGGHSNPIKKRGGGGGGTQKGEGEEIAGEVNTQSNTQPETNKFEVKAYIDFMVDSIPNTSPLYYLLNVSNSVSSETSSGTIELEPSALKKNLKEKMVKVFNNQFGNVTNVQSDKDLMPIIKTLNDTMTTELGNLSKEIEETGDAEIDKAIQASMDVGTLVKLHMMNFGYTFLNRALSNPTINNTAVNIARSVNIINNYINDTTTTANEVYNKAKERFSAGLNKGIRCARNNLRCMNTKATIAKKKLKIKTASIKTELKKYLSIDNQQENLELKQCQMATILNGIYEKADMDLTANAISNIPLLLKDQAANTAEET